MDERNGHLSSGAVLLIAALVLAIGWPIAAAEPPAESVPMMDVVVAGMVAPTIAGGESVYRFLHTDLAPVEQLQTAESPQTSDGPRFTRGAEVTRGAALYFAFAGIYLLMGVVFLIFWRWLRRDLPMLSLALFCFAMALHSAAISGTLPVVFPAIDPGTSTVLRQVGLMLLNALIAWMLWSFFPHAFYPAASSRSHMMNSSIAVAAALMSFAFAAAGGEAILTASRWVTVALVVVMMDIAGRTLGSRTEHRAVTTLGFGLLIGGSLVDLLVTGPADRTYVMPFAVLLFVLLQSYVMIRRTAEETLRAHVSGKRLRREVDARTRALKAASEEAQAASAEAQAANLAKTEFVTAITHELRTPLSSMIGYIRLLREELDERLSEQHVDFFDTLEESGDRLLNLVNKLLDLATIESGRVDLNLEPVDAASVIEQVCSELYPLAKEKRLSLRTHVDVEDPTVLADEQWLSVVLSDLASNAIKYTSEGGVVMRLRTPDATALSIQVIDTGPGISKEFMPKLFERFSREEHARAGSPTGTGLGLTIVRELVHLMRGEIQVESEVGVGSTFTVVLPRPGRAISTAQDGAEAEDPAAP